MSSALPVIDVEPVTAVEDGELPRVLVVGSGPTGLAAANLLGSMGVPVLLVERNSTTSDEAKAISLDDESLRSLGLAGLATPMYDIILPGTGTKYFGARGQALVHARGDGSYRFGHPFKNAFAQPQFEQVLHDSLDRSPAVEQRFCTELVDLHQSDDGVAVTLRRLSDSTLEHVQVDYVLGCDGGRSTVRELLGIGMSGESFDEVWLVVDTLDDPHDQRYGMHHGDPHRPHVIVPGRDGRCRYEFLLRPGEGAAGEVPHFPLVQRLLEPYRRVAPEHIERAVNYRFHALLADRLRDRRCFLLGDAAHMMPPFAGQGLNSGLRDAVNLSWKIAEVLGQAAPDALLDTYEVERRPHAEAVIRLSVRLRDVVMTTNRLRAGLRDLVVATAMRTRRGRRYLREMRYRPSTALTTGAVVRRGPGRDQELVGTPIPQPLVLRGPGHELARLDDVLGRGWSTLGINLEDADWSALVAGGCHAGVGGTLVDVALDDRTARGRGGREAIADADGRLENLLAPARGRFVLIRPDRIVAAVYQPADSAKVAAALEPFLGARPAPEPHTARSIERIRQ